MPSYRIYHASHVGTLQDTFTKNKELDYDQRSLESNHLKEEVEEDDVSDISIDDIPLPPSPKKAKAKEGSDHGK